MFRFLPFIFCSCVLGAPSIVFIHLGRSLPAYLPVAVHQARLFNEDCSIYLVANEQALTCLPELLVENKVICVPAESLPLEREHATFQKLTPLDRQSRDGFWMFATERFFYLFELMKQRNLSDVFHLEYDNMLYADVRKFLPVFHRFYRKKIGATFDHDYRCIAGLIYISDLSPLQHFLHFVTERVRIPKNDMEWLASFKSVDGGAHIDHLPIVLPEYAIDHPLVSAHRHLALHKELYSNHFDLFQCVFDAAAIGQYLGGIDPNNGVSSPGFINESCVFNPALFQYEWVLDEKDRLIPMIIYQKARCPVVNLHIHSKNLTKFHSRRNES